MQSQNILDSSLCRWDQTMTKTYRICLHHVEILRNMPRDLADPLAQIFTIEVIEPAQVVLREKEPVQIIAVIVDGEMEVLTQAISGQVLGCLSYGAVIGEMSLIEPNQKASAAVRASAKGATILKCRLTCFHDFLSRHPNASTAFYKGAAEVLSRRLRVTNTLIEERMQAAQGFVGEILREFTVFQSSHNEGEAVDEAGAKMAQSLTTCLLQLEACIAENTNRGLEDVRVLLQKVVLEDLQIMDRVAQKLRLVQQILLNLDRAFRGESVEAMKGDISLLRI
jgi:CRP-like cAMP-binding protein